VTAARVLVVGSANVDYTVAVPRLPGPGETVSGGTLLVAFGGKGANQAVAARRLGAEVALVARVGADANGRAIVAALGAEGIDVSGVTADPDAATGIALIVVDAGGGNQIAVAPGANRRLTPAHAAAARQALDRAQAVVGQLETPPETVAWTLAEGRRRGAVTVLNPAPVPDAPLDVWPLVDYLTPNAGELERLTGVAAKDEPTARAAARVLLDRGVRHVLVTRGADGVLAVSAETALAVPSPRVHAVDTTGAGDAFAGALAVALAEGRALPAALRFATTAAALACTGRGAQPSLPTRAEVARRLEEDP
jgi:ribokinase